MQDTTATFLSTVLGSLLAFALGLYAFKLQQDQQRKIENEKDFANSITYLNIMIEAAVTNMESIIILKRQFIDNMKAEATEIEKLSKGFNELKGEDFEIFVQSFRKKWNETQFPRQRLPILTQYHLPNPEHINHILTDAPSLYYLNFKGKCYLDEAIQAIEFKNNLNIDQSVESTQSIVLPRLIYYVDMQTSATLAALIHRRWPEGLAGVA